ncbi:MAG: histidine kinase dimerization/phospho-acceptor domain-containing protein, partial [Bacteroidota bacterium]
MLEQDLHRLLRRQIKRFGQDILDDPKYADFVFHINKAFKNFDKDIKHAEHILEESSRELFIANQKIKAERDDTMAKLENIVDNVNGVIFETDLKGNFTFLNNSWTAYTGIPISESLGKNYRDFLISKNDDKDEKINNLFSAKGEEVKFIFKHKILKKRYWFEVKTKLIRDKNYKATGYIGTIIDVTALKDSEIKLKEAAKSKDEFLSTMSHEIRTPLNAVTGISNIMLIEDYLPQQADNLKALKYSSEHLMGLINDLLDFDKIKSGKMKVVQSKFSLSIFLENIKSHFSLRAKEKGLKFQVICDENIPNNIVGDKLKLTQIIKNL